MPFDTDLAHGPSPAAMDMQLAMRRGFGLSAWLAAFIRVSVAVIVSTADSLLAAEWNGRPARERASAGAGTASGAAPKGRSGRCRGSAGALRTASARRWLGCVFKCLAGGVAHDQGL
jgi:hypothetical protein